MRLARESRYALEALVVLGSVPTGEMMEAREIAERANLPAPFLSKIRDSGAAVTFNTRTSSRRWAR